MEVREYIELNDNERNTYQNSRDAGKAVLRGNCIALNLYVKKTKNYQVRKGTLK